MRLRVLFLAPLLALFLPTQRDATASLNARFAASAPAFRRSTTHANWEGVGVVPDVTVPGGDALATALRRLGHRP